MSGVCDASPASLLSTSRDRLADPLTTPKSKGEQDVKNRNFEGSRWLAPWEQDEVIASLLASSAGLIRWDNSRSLSLKSGGKTDIYLNLREARSDPEMLILLAELYANPLWRLGMDRFAEVPDSVSCFAGPLSVLTRLPLVTLREEAKLGRVAKANVIGKMERGEELVIIDDVVTDGASKIAPVRACLAAGVNLGPLVVLVDREQGWRSRLNQEGLAGLQVWSGMTLHDVRRYLIEHGIMERCDKDVEAKNPLIVALDGKSWDDILPTVDRLRTTGCVLKVNDLLVWEGGRRLVRDLQVYGRVMVDIKGHDIPNTIANILARFSVNPPWAVTVHASGGEEMIASAVAAFKGTPTMVLAVTVLTSIDPKTCEEIYTRLPLDQVKVLAAIAAKAGAHGLVCSPEEAAELRRLYPNMKLVTPGIRSAGKDQGDQKRIGTPSGAIEAGASHLVMGRQILGADDPVLEVNRLLKEELALV